MAMLDELEEEENTFHRQWNACIGNHKRILLFYQHAMEMCLENLVVDETEHKQSKPSRVNLDPVGFPRAVYAVYKPHASQTRTWTRIITFIQIA